MYRNTLGAVIESSSVNYHSVIIPITNNLIDIKIDKNCIYIKGVLGELYHKIHNSLDIKFNELRQLIIYTKYFHVNNLALVGTTKSLIYGMITGVSIGFVKKLQLVGVGYRVSIKDHILTLMIGLSHSINYKLPMSIKVQCLSQTEIMLTGINKQLIGQVAADLRSIRPPEPFKGKGIRYSDEIIDTKDSKKR